MFGYRRDWNNQDFGTAKPAAKTNTNEGGLICSPIVRGGVPFQEPVKFRFGMAGAKLFTGGSASNGTPQKLAPMKKIF